jgi:hypothetical protein
MSTYNVWRVYCTTDGKEETWILPADEPAPTTCPTNTAHTIDSAETIVEKEISDTIVTVKEETTPTYGKFWSRTITATAAAGSTASSYMWWDYPVSVLAIEFTSGPSHRGDSLDLVVAPNTTIGALAANPPTVTAWTSQNYTAGDTVSYTDATFGAGVYTCHTDTVSNEVPTDTTYWRIGLKLTVTSTVVANCTPGRDIRLTDGGNADDVGEVVSVDAVNSAIYVQLEPGNTYLAATPTYVQVSIYMLRDWSLGEPWGYEIGSSKIGGTYLPPRTLIEARYTNNGVASNSITGEVEYLA